MGFISPGTSTISGSDSLHPFFNDDIIMCFSRSSRPSVFDTLKVIRFTRCCCDVLLFSLKFSLACSNVFLGFQKYGLKSPTMGVSTLESLDKEESKNGMKEFSSRKGYWHLASLIELYKNSIITTKTLRTGLHLYWIGVEFQLMKMVSLLNNLKESNEI